MQHAQFVIGVDFGTDSVRSVIVDALDGREIASSVFHYPRWRDGLYCDASKNRFRQHPKDYVEGLEATIKSCLAEAGPGASRAIRGISVDTTGSSPVAVDRSGTPLALVAGFEENPNAMFVLWKDHTAVREAAEINRHAEGFPVDYLRYVGGVYSSEWFWAKWLHILRTDEAVRDACYSWVEHCDWIPYLLTGSRDVHAMKRSRCAAGHKALWAEAFGGLPPDGFFAALDPLLKGYTKRLFSETYTADQPAGALSPEWSERLGLSPDVVVGVGAFDAHMGAVGGQIEPYHLSKVMGTSTCDMLVAPLEESEHILVKGICGQVPGSVLPGMMGMEAGQSAFGDVYAWFVRLLTAPMREIAARTEWGKDLSRDQWHDTEQQMLAYLAEAASEIPVTVENELALDWLNGRRTPNANQELKAAISGLDLASGAPAVFRALAESTCFGARQITDCFTSQGVPVRGLIGLGGVARKSPFIMQMMADVMNMPIRIHRSDQTCAIGAAMFAAVAAGIYSRAEEAMAAMGQGFDLEYFPAPAKAAVYEERYRRYSALGDFVEQALSTGQVALRDA